ncbi:terminase small subunit [Ectobacillus antri]|uniref:terminase small subunit n=1 Tax=Ectobacillus antri TaxID=2486280 RepID=UPI000F59394B|nr:terminase small subunit [Ectobacillus antri]
MTLNERQKAFADYYIQLGSAEAAARKAGYSERYARGNAHKLVANSGIKAYIEERNKQIESRRIADMTEVKEFWTYVLRDNNAESKDRLKASEYIAKTNAAFVEKVQHSGEMTQNVNATVEVDYKKYTLEELKQLEALAAKLTQSE